MDLMRIKEICKQKKLGVAELATNIGMSPQNLHRSIRLNQIQASDLESIARQLGVNICCFFDNDTLCGHFEQYSASGKNGFVAKNIENVDNRDMSVLQSNASEATAAEVIVLQQKLLEAQNEIINLLKEKK